MINRKEGGRLFPETLQFHIAPNIDSFINWLTVAGSPLFSLISNFTLGIVREIQTVLTFLPWWFWIILAGFVNWWQTRKLIKTVGIILLSSIGVFGLWKEAIDTLAVVLTAVIMAFMIGIPLGIIMATFNRANSILTPLLDGMQTMPSFVYLLPAMMKEVRLPLAMPSILAGLNQTTMMALAMVVIASMIGAGGLGEKVLIAVNRIAVGKGFEAGFAVVALAIVIDRITQGFVRRNA